jgi:hypothetical protein
MSSSGTQGRSHTTVLFQNKWEGTKSRVGAAVCQRQLSIAGSVRNAQWYSVLSASVHPRKNISLSNMLRGAVDWVSTKRTSPRLRALTTFRFALPRETVVLYLKVLSLRRGLLLSHHCESMPPMLALLFPFH